MDELRVAREKLIALDDKSKRDERNSLMAQERMVQLEEKCRMYKHQIRTKSTFTEGAVSEVSGARYLT